MRREISATVKIWTVILWVMNPGDLVDDHRRFRGTCGLYTP